MPRIAEHSVVQMVCTVYSVVRHKICICLLVKVQQWFCSALCSK